MQGGQSISSFVHRTSGGVVGGKPRYSQDRQDEFVEAALCLLRLCIFHRCQLI